MRKLCFLITLFVLSISCSESDYETQNFILNQAQRLNYSIEKENKVLYVKILKQDSSLIAFRDSTASIIYWINSLQDKLKNSPKPNWFSNKSKGIVSEVIFNSGYGLELKNVLNNYCRFMSRPDFKVWNIATDAKDINLHLDSPQSLTPFEQFYFSNTTAGQALIIIELLKTEVLNIESRFYLFRLNKKALNIL